MRLFVVVHAAALAGLLAGPTRVDAQRLSQSQRCCFPAETKPYEAKTFPDHGLEDSLAPAGRTTRGLYLTPHWVDRVPPTKTASLLGSAHLNAVVIDFKDSWGQVLYRSGVPLSKRVQRRLIANPAKLVKQYRDAGIYVIARIVCFRDSKMPLRRPDLSGRSAPNGRRLFSSDSGWLDPYSREVQDYILAIALEVESFGVDEIQFDYVRFPKGTASAYAMWLHDDGQSRADVITGFLERADRALRVPLSADVFGLMTFVDGDPRGLGQTLERVAPYVEALSPMMYPNGMTSYFRNGDVDRRIHTLIQCGLWRARHKAPGVALRPFLQAHPAAVSDYGPDWVREQILVAEKAGSDGFLFWDPTLKTSDSFTALRGLGRTRLERYGRDGDKRVEPRAPGDWCPLEGDLFP